MSINGRRAIYGKLANPGAGYTKAIYYQSIPDGADFPCVVFQKQSGQIRWAFNKTNSLNDEVWLVKGVDRNDDTADPVEQISDRLKALLDDATLSISGATHIYLRHEMDTDYSEDVEGKRYIHSGSMFRFAYQA